MSNTGIEYGDQSWNITSGCSRISAGCDNCWAEKMSKRLKGRFGYPEKRPFTPTFHEDRLRDPYSWKKKRHCVLVSFMGDLFHEGIKDDQICKVLDMIAVTPEHTYMILTKRPERWQDVRNYCVRHIGFPYFHLIVKVSGYLPNLWIGTSIESDKQIHRLDELKKIPAAGRFISAEPLIGALDLSGGKLEGIDLILVGGESGGKHSRPMHPLWARNIHDECEKQDTHFYFKQWGDWIPYTQADLNQKYYEATIVTDGRGNYESMMQGRKKYTGHLLDGEEFLTMPPIPKMGRTV